MIYFNPNECAKDVFKLICRRFGVTLDEIMSRNSSRRCYKPRRIAMCLIKRAMPDVTHFELANIFNRNYSTMSYALNNGCYVDEIDMLWDELNAREGKEASDE